MAFYIDLRNDCNNFSVDGGIPPKMDGTQHYAHSGATSQLELVVLYIFLPWRDFQCQVLETYVE